MISNEPHVSNMQERHATPIIGDLNQKKMAYENGEKTPNAIELHRRLNAIKPTELPWMYEVSKCSPQEALRNLDNVPSTTSSRRRQVPEVQEQEEWHRRFPTDWYDQGDGEQRPVATARFLRLKERATCPRRQDTVCKRVRTCRTVVREYSVEEDLPVSGRQGRA
jgi:hypothetical protein